MNFYLPRSRDGTYLHDNEHIAGKMNDQPRASWNNDQMISNTLIDGELLILGTDGNLYKNHSQLGRSGVQRYLFFAFDMLYGPTVITPKIEFDFYVHEYGNFSSMQGPRIMGRNIKGEGGQIHRGWTYERRHHQMTMFVDRDYKLREDLVNISPLCRYFHQFVKWFVVFSKPIYDLKEISSEYNSVKRRRMSFENFVITSYTNKLRRQIDNIKNIVRSKGGTPISNYFPISKLKFDGLIFTPKHGQYISGAAIAPLNTTFKYKDMTKASIDLIMHKGKLCARKGRNFLHIRDTVHVDIPEGTVAEFNLIDNLWVFSELRPDKTKPNSIYAIENIKRSLTDPVDLREIVEIIDGSADRSIIKKHMNTTGVVPIVPYFFFHDDNIKQEFIGEEHRLGQNEVIKMNLSDNQMEAIALMFKHTFTMDYKYFKCKGHIYEPVEGEGKVYRVTENITKRKISGNNKLSVRKESVYKEIKPDNQRKNEIAFDIVKEIRSASVSGTAHRFNKREYDEINVLGNNIFKLEKMYIYKPYGGKAKLNEIINTLTMENYNLFILHMIFYYLSVY